MINSAEFSACGLYRYTLTRIWDESKPIVNWVALNPSKADHEINDPTIIREMNFTRSWGYGGLIKTNIFAYRSTDPRALYTLRDPVGPENDAYLQSVALKSDLILAAWGTHGALRGRGTWVYHKTLRDFPLHCLAFTKGGYPKHPLYMPADSKPTPYSWRAY